jgi:hypothetical protein
VDFQVWQRYLDAKECPAHVPGHYSVEMLFRDLFDIQWRVRASAGIVDEYVDPAERRHRGARHNLDICNDADIGAHSNNVDTVLPKLSFGGSNGVTIQI